MATRGSFHALIGGMSALGCAPPQAVPDASFDAIPCEMRTPIEVVSGINYSHFAALWPGSRFNPRTSSGAATPLPDGDLLAVGAPGDEYVVRLTAQGRLIPAFHRGRSLQLASDGTVVFFASDATSYRVTPGQQYLEVGLADLQTGTVVAVTPLQPIDNRCEGVARWSPVVSGGHCLMVRAACSERDHRRGIVLERWEQQGAEMVRTVGPIEAPEPGDRNLIGNTTVSPDGHGGLWYLGGVPTADGTNFTVHAVHWDGTDTPPVLSAHLGDPPEPGQIGFGAFGEVLASGDYLMAINAVSRGFTRTWVARVRPDMSFAWTWTSPVGFVSGPEWVAADTFGDETRILLYEPASRLRVYVQGLDAEGHEVWPEPRLIRDFSMPRPGFDSQPVAITRLAVHRDGSFTAHTSGETGTVTHETTYFTSDAVPQSTATRSGGGEFGLALYPDENFGVWIYTLGYIQHYDRTGWPLYRSWFYGESCGNERPGIVTRTGPDAEPMTYFYDNGWPPRPRL